MILRQSKQQRIDKHCFLTLTLRFKLVLDTTSSSADAIRRLPQMGASCPRRSGHWETRLQYGLHTGRERRVTSSELHKKEKIMCEFTEKRERRLVIVFLSQGNRKEEAHKHWSFQTLFLRRCCSFFSHIWRFQSPVCLTCRQTEWLTWLTWPDFPNKNRICSVCLFVSLTHSAWSLSQLLSAAHVVELPVPMDFWLVVYGAQTSLRLWEALSPY